MSILKQDKGISKKHKPYFNYLILFAEFYLFCRRSWGVGPGENLLGRFSPQLLYEQASLLCSNKPLSLRAGLSSRGLCSNAYEALTPFEESPSLAFVPTNREQGAS
jgi:hypothetical protein